jgi:hypothetical protein
MIFLIYKLQRPKESQGGVSISPGLLVKPPRFFDSTYLGFIILFNSLLPSSDAHARTRVNR